MKKLIKFLIPVFVFLILFAPVLISAQGLVPCNNTPVEGKIPDKELCGFKAFMTLINKVINFILFSLAVPIAALMCAYAGVLMLTGGGESAGNRTKAKGVFTNAILGLVIAAGAWVIVNTLLTILGYDGTWIGFKFNI